MARRSSQATMRGGNGGARQVPWWIWFLGGLFCGLGLSALVLMKEWAPQLREGEASVAKPAPPAAPVVEDKPKYDFYSVLPEMEVVVPDAEVKSAANAPVPNPATPTAPATGAQRYLLQAGSFRNSGDADALKAKLTLLGMHASVQAVNVNGTEYFRVRVGPYADLREVDAAKRALEGNGINAIALRESGGQ